jgi:hypothetical protein
MHRCKSEQARRLWINLEIDRHAARQERGGVRGQTPESKFQWQEVNSKLLIAKSPRYAMWPFSWKSRKGSPKEEQFPGIKGRTEMLGKIRNIHTFAAMKTQTTAHSNGKLRLNFGWSTFSDLTASSTTDNETPELILLDAAFEEHGFEQRRFKKPEPGRSAWWICSGTHKQNQTWIWQFQVIRSIK